MFAAALTAAAVESACGGGHVALPEPTTTQVAVSVATPARRVVDMSILPDQLPPAVAQAADAAVSVEYAYDKPVDSDTFTRNIDEASGFRIAPDTYITAGHAVHDENDQPLPYVNVCGNLKVFVPSDKPTASTSFNGEAHDLYGSDLSAERYFGRRLQRKSDILADMAIFNTSADSDQASQPIVEVAPHQPTVGDPVYFINFQPTDDGRSRSASQEQVWESGGSISDLATLTKPAIYGGIVVSIQDGNVFILTGGKSYVPLGDSYMRRGASGGMVVNQQGQVVAESVASVRYGSIGSPYARDYLENQARLTIEGVGATTEMGMEVARPITMPRIHEFLAELSTAPNCTIDTAHTVNH